MGRVNFLSSLFSMTDEQAMWRVQTQDDHRAFVQLLERWEEPIGRLCARMTGDVHRGEDLKQETFARVFEKRKSFQPSARFSTWLWRIALNLCYDELRRINRRSHGYDCLAGRNARRRVVSTFACFALPDVQLS